MSMVDLTLHEKKGGKQQYKETLQRKYMRTC
jgi:hypothetical protein